MTGATIAPTFRHTSPTISASGPGPLALIRAGLFSGLLAVTLIGVAAPRAHAQDAQVQGLVDRLERVQRELQTLQRHVYRGETPPAAAAAAAAPLSSGSGGLNTTVAARIELRLSQLEAQLRELTGRIEESSHRQVQLRGQIDKLAADTDLRLRQLEQGGGALATGGLQGGAPGEGQLAETGQDGLLGQPVGGAAPRTLGTIPAEDLAALQAEKVQQVSPDAGAPAAQGQTAQAYALSGATPEAQYKSAFGLLSQANYGEAELALRAFVDQHPDDPLAGNAKYWLGETYYVRQDFQQAAITFAEAYQRYPDNSKAPDNLLKLGMSLSALGSKPDACGTFAELLKRYPNAAVTVQQRAKQERQRLGCP